MAGFLCQALFRLTPDFFFLWEIFLFIFYKFSFDSYLTYFCKHVTIRLQVYVNQF